MSPSWSVQKCLADVVGIARVVPLETGVGTHRKPNPAQLETVLGANQSAEAWFSFFVFFLSPLFSRLFPPGGEGVFGRALTKRAWLPPNQPEEKNKTNEKGKERRERCRGCGGRAGRALTKRALIIPKKPEGRNKTNEKARKTRKGARGAGSGWLLRANGTGPWALSEKPNRRFVKNWNKETSPG